MSLLEEYYISSCSFKFREEESPLGIGVQTLNIERK